MTLRPPIAGGRLSGEVKCRADRPVARSTRSSPSSFQRPSTRIENACCSRSVFDSGSSQVFNRSPMKWFCVKPSGPGEGRLCFL